MKCDEAAAFIDAYVDGELDIARSVEIEQHLQSCPACSRTYRGHQALRGAIADAGLNYAPPPELRGRVRSAVHREASGGHSPRRTGWMWRPLAIAAMVAFAVTLSWSLWLLRSTPSASEVLAQEVVGSHLRSLMGEHLMDVASTDQHTVKPWFNGKLDFSPPVVDLKKEGFELVGGRLDFLGGKPAAALVYRRGKHVINLYVQPAKRTAEVAPATATRLGYHEVHWVQGGFSYWAVSDVNEKELGHFADLVRANAQTPQPESPNLNP